MTRASTATAAITCSEDALVGPPTLREHGTRHAIEDERTQRESTERK